MQTKFRPHRLFDKIRRDFKLKSDAELARALDLRPEQLSRMRSRHLSVGAVIILKIHDATGYEIRDIKAMIAEAA